MAAMTGNSIQKELPYYRQRRIDASST